MGEPNDVAALMWKASQAHTNLTMFHAIISLCESGCFYGPQPETARVIFAAKAGAQRCLREYDSAINQALKDPQP